MFTVDASVWLNADSPAEPNYQGSRDLMDRVALEQAVIIVPTLLQVDVAGVISRIRGDSVAAIQYVQAMLKLPFVRWIPLDDALAARATSIAAGRALRGADAVYAAVAMAHNCQLVSLDKEHLTRLPSLLSTLTPADTLTRWTRSTP
jgi:predicted nucleic acid-binding protein